MPRPLFTHLSRTTVALGRTPISYSNSRDCQRRAEWNPDRLASRPLETIRAEPGGSARIEENAFEHDVRETGAEGSGLRYLTLS